MGIANIDHLKLPSTTQASVAMSLVEGGRLQAHIHVSIPGRQCGQLQDVSSFNLRNSEKHCLKDCLKHCLKHFKVDHSFHTLSHPFTPCHTLSHPFTPFHTLSHHQSRSPPSAPTHLFMSIKALAWLRVDAITLGEDLNHSQFWPATSSVVYNVHQQTEVFVPNNPDMPLLSASDADQPIHK